MKKEAHEVFVEQNQRMRAVSGNVQSDDPLVQLIYILSRDDITMGAMEHAMRQVHLAEGSSMTFTNGWLAKYAEDVASRIRGMQKPFVSETEKIP